MSAHTRRLMIYLLVLWEKNSCRIRKLLIRPNCMFHMYTQFSYSVVSITCLQRFARRRQLPYSVTSSQPSPLWVTLASIASLLRVSEDSGHIIYSALVLRWSSTNKMNPADTVMAPTSILKRLRWPKSTALSSLGQRETERILC